MRLVRRLALVLRVRSVALPHRHAPTSEASAALDTINIIDEVDYGTGTDRGTPPVVTFNAGLTGLIGPSLQVDVGRNIGLDDAALKQQLYAGVSHQF